MTLVMRCIVSVTYIVGINGGRSTRFVPSRGLRQGDPLNPYLFFICAKCLSTLLVEAQEKQLIKGVCLARSHLAINNLFFTNDGILFGEATKEGVENIRWVLVEYEKSSGHLVNYDKSLVYFWAKINERDRNMVSDQLQVHVSSNPENYL